MGRRTLSGTLLVLLVFLLPLFAGVTSPLAEEVDLKLVLAVDCSASVDASEYALQMGAIADAFRQDDIRAAIGSGPVGAIAITVVQWSSQDSQITVLPWTKVTPESTLQTATLIAALDRRTSDGATSISAAIRHSARLLDTSPYTAFRETMDISADGRNNNGPTVTALRDAVTASGRTINGLAITNVDRTLDIYFRRDVIGGPDAFVIKALDYDDFAQAFRRKLLREIQYVPVADGLPDTHHKQAAAFGLKARSVMSDVRGERHINP